MAPQVSFKGFTVAATVGLLLLSAVPADALNSRENRCRDLVANAARHAASRVLKFRTRCVHRKLTAEIPTSVQCDLDANTGHPETDKRLLKFERSRVRAGDSLTRSCDHKSDTRDVDPADILVSGSACGDLDTWREVGECAVNLGKSVGDGLFELLNVTPVGAPLTLPEIACFVETAEQARHGLFTTNLWRAKCFRADERFSPGGGFFDCDAISAWPGTVGITGLRRADERLIAPLVALRKDVSTFCDLVHGPVGFAGTIPDRSQGDFAGKITPDDIIDSIADAIITGSTEIMIELFPVEEFCGDGSVIGAAEQCDDSNNTGDDGCDRDCSDPACPNGSIDGQALGEECDDGNTFNGDGCSSSCEVQRCGNGVVNAGWFEVCDDANASDNDLCPSGAGRCFAHASCGDGYICSVGCGPSTEQCDGSNLGGATCASQGFTFGNLACNGSCGFDTSGCF